MTDDKRGLILDALEDAVERYRRAQLFEAADVAYRQARAIRDPDLDGWENTLADGISG